MENPHNSNENDSSSTSLITFTEAVNNFLISTILTPLSHHIERNKNVKVTTDEMVQYLNLPVNRNQNAVIPDMSNIAGYIRDINNTETKKGTRGRKKIPRNINPETANKCKYVFRGGSSRGKVCEALCEEGEVYCNECKKRKPLKEVLSRAEKNQSQSQSQSPTQTVQEQVSDEATIFITPYMGREGYYIEQQNQYVGRYPSDGKFVVEFIVEGSKERPLRDNERAKALELGLHVVS